MWTAGNFLCGSSRARASARTLSSPSFIASVSFPRLYRYSVASSKFIITHSTSRRTGRLTEGRAAESVPRAVASEALSIGLLIEPRSLPLAVLIRLYAVFGFANFGVSHEPAPDVSAAQVLGAEQGDADVNADHVGIDPAGGRVEGVGETISAVNLLSEFLFHLAQGGQRDFRREHQRSARGAGHDRPVNRPLSRRPAPGVIAMLCVGSRDAPNVLRVARKLFRQVLAESPMRARGDHGVFEIIDSRRLAFMPSPKIHPGMRVLVNEERRWRAQILVLAVSDPVALPRVPRLRRDRMRRRADGQQIMQRDLGVIIPPVLDETAFGPPAMRKQARIAVEHPLKIDPVINLRRQPDDLLVVAKVSSRRQHAAEQPGRVDG